MTNFSPNVESSFNGDPKESVNGDASKSSKPEADSFKTVITIGGSSKSRQSKSLNSSKNGNEPIVQPEVDGKSSLGSALDADVEDEDSLGSIDSDDPKHQDALAALQKEVRQLKLQLQRQKAAMTPKLTDDDLDDDDEDDDSVDGENEDVDDDDKEDTEDVGYEDCSPEESKQYFHNIDRHPPIDQRFPPPERNCFTLDRRLQKRLWKSSTHLSRSFENLPTQRFMNDGEEEEEHRGSSRLNQTVADFSSANRRQSTPHRSTSNSTFQQHPFNSFFDASPDEIPTLSSRREPSHSTPRPKSLHLQQKAVPDFRTHGQTLPKQQLRQPPQHLSHSMQQLPRQQCYSDSDTDPEILEANFPRSKKSGSRKAKQMMQQSYHRQQNQYDQLQEPYQQNIPQHSAQRQPQHLQPEYVDPRLLPIQHSHPNISSASLGPNFASNPLYSPTSPDDVFQHSEVHYHQQPYRQAQHQPNHQAQHIYHSQQLSNPNYQQWHHQQSPQEPHSIASPRKTRVEELSSHSIYSPTGPGHPGHPALSPLSPNRVEELRSPSGKMMPNSPINDGRINGKSPRSMPGYASPSLNTSASQSASAAMAAAAAAGVMAAGEMAASRPLSRNRLSSVYGTPKSRRESYT